MKKTLLIATTLLAAASSQAFSADIATFGKSKITDSDYKQAVKDLGERGEMIKTNKQVRSQFLNHLIDNSLLSEEATKANLQKSEQFKKMVDAAKKEILSRLYVEQYIAENSKPSKLKDYCKKNTEKFSSKEV